MARYDLQLVDGAEEDHLPLDLPKAKMERLYRRNEEDRGFVSIEAVRCPTCGRVLPWRHRRPRPFCKHDPDQSSFYGW